MDDLTALTDDEFISLISGEPHSDEGLLEIPEYLAEIKRRFALLQARETEACEDAGLQKARAGDALAKVERQRLVLSKQAESIKGYVGNQNKLRAELADCVESHQRTNATLAEWEEENDTLCGLVKELCGPMIEIWADGKEVKHDYDEGACGGPDTCHYCGTPRPEGQDFYSLCFNPDCPAAYARLVLEKNNDGI